MVYLCSNLIIIFASICESTTQYKLTYPYPPGHTPVVLAKPPRALDLEYFYPHHLDLPPVMKDIPTAPPLPDPPPAQDFSKLGFVYITVLGLANQVVPHTGSWRPIATTLNYLVHIAPIVYMAFQARPASPVGVQLDSSKDRDNDQCPSIFVTFMNKVFAPHIGKHTLVYLDGIIVYSPLVEQHQKDLKAVFATLA
ncbi:hypothetical protein DSO57_1010090 [Entomophthora muscae]|uniref:Uncharacterized protein n=1 Tax=Entomophthora muscae TaxID=34485 RepID=A0ACC2T6H9_9FUNG|nr:hypothetical protein DSO57_1010090 [Entomophthora muscae]